VPDPTHCEQCREPLLHRLKAGRPQKFCSARCRQAAYYRRHVLISRDKVIQLLKAAEGKK